MVWLKNNGGWKDPIPLSLSSDDVEGVYHLYTSGKGANIIFSIPGKRIKASGKLEPGFTECNAEITSESKINGYVLLGRYMDKDERTGKNLERTIGTEWSGRLVR